MLETRTVNLGDGHKKCTKRETKEKNMQTAVAIGFKFKGLYTDICDHFCFNVLLFYRSNDVVESRRTRKHYIL